MTNTYHQISLKDTFSDCKDMFMDDAPSFFQILEQHFDISLFIPSSLYHAFYQSLGRKRVYPLTGFLSAPYPSKNFSYPNRFPFDSSVKYLQRTQGFLRFFKGHGCSLFYSF